MVYINAVTNDKTKFDARDLTFISEQSTRLISRYIYTGNYYDTLPLPPITAI